MNFGQYPSLKLTQPHIRNLQEVPGTAGRIADRIEVDTGVCGARMTQMGRNPLPTR